MIGTTRILEKQNLLQMSQVLFRCPRMANAFTIDTNAFVLTVNGAGIVNTSGKAQTIDNISGTIEFLGISSAGSTTIINFAQIAGGGFFGLTTFNGASTAGSATITNNGGATISAGSGFAQFMRTSTAGNATIINNGGVASGDSGGLTGFFNTSTAGSATIISNGGNGLGGKTEFLDSSDGGTARAIMNGNGVFDISSLSTAGMGIASIESSGNYFLGSKNLSVGGNNLSTTVSGVIQDGGALTLTGANTYTGTTTVSSGALVVSGSIASVQTVVNSGGFLGGRGTIGGNLGNNGVVAQFNSRASCESRSKL